MAFLEMSEWYDLARETNWTPKYVSEDELFPAPMSNSFGIPVEEWETFDEPYKVSYRDYVRNQREKDVGTYSVKAAPDPIFSRIHRPTGRRFWRCISALSAGPSFIPLPRLPA
jgi:hypothetical protein